jgi:hypothetical protein
MPDGTKGGILYLNVDGINLANAVPEPSTWAMMLLGFAVLGFLAHRRRRQTKLAWAAACSASLSHMSSRY